MRAVQAVGYDMDYTLIHYNVDAWERAAFTHARDRLAAEGWPIGNLTFDPDEFTLGLVFDLQLGNVVKATRFGYVVRAQHGSHVLTFEEQRNAYRETEVQLSRSRFRFMNTLFELSRASLFCQLVDLFDQRKLEGVSSYQELDEAIDTALGAVHNDGSLKAEILSDPARFVEPDPNIVPTLHDQKAAGKKLLLITNSDWAYTRRMMAYTFDQYCPPGTTWRDLFDVVIVSANKPRFFSAKDPIYRVEDEERSLLAPFNGVLEQGRVYFGGNARLVEDSLGLSGGQPLYVGDHLFGDVHVSKDVLRWRTALIARELEAEIDDAAAFADEQEELRTLMREKIDLEHGQALLRMDALREPPGDQARLDELATMARQLDERVAPLAASAGQLGNIHWGPVMRAGNDKSLFARQVERYADVYTSRVSNFLHETPFAYLRAARGSLPHDQQDA